MTYLLIVLSLILGLLGTFTETHTQGERRRLTRWGELVGILLVASAAFTAWDQHRSAQEKDQARERAILEAQTLRKTLSDQRLITLAALGTGYEAARSPLVIFNYESDSSSPRYQADFDTAGTFPGFGAPLRAYQLSLALSEHRQQSFDSAQAAIPDEQRGPGGITYQPDPLNEEFNHVFSTSRFHTLAEVVMDFRPGKRIGELRLWRRGGTFSTAELARIRRWLGSPRCTVFVQADMARKGSDLYGTHLEIPLQVNSGTVAGDMITFALTTGDPGLTSYDFDPT